VLLDSLEQLLAGYRDNTLIGTIANHRVRLATARLPIGKQRTVVPFPGIVQNAITQIFKNLFLKKQFSI
jgi:hypothetical protein